MEEEVCELRIRKQAIVQGICGIAPLDALGRQRRLEGRIADHHSDRRLQDSTFLGLEEATPVQGHVGQRRKKPYTSADLFGLKGIAEAEAQTKRSELDRTFLDVYPVDALKQRAQVVDARACPPVAQPPVQHEAPIGFDEKYARPTCRIQNDAVTGHQSVEPFPAQHFLEH